MTTPKDELAKYATQSQMSAFFIDKMGIINVKSYGALGDGVTDDSTGLQSAINACTTGPYNFVWLPKGTYVNTGLTDSTKIRFLTNSTATLFSGSTYPINQWTGIGNQVDGNLTVTGNLNATGGLITLSTAIIEGSLTVGGAINSTVGLATFSTMVVEGNLTVGGNYRTTSTGLRLELTSSGELKQYNASSVLHGMWIVKPSSDDHARIRIYKNSAETGYLAGTSNAVILTNSGVDSYVAMGSTSQVAVHELRGNWKANLAFGCNGSTGSTSIALAADLSTTIGASSDLNRTNSLLNEIKNALIAFGLCSS